MNTQSTPPSTSLFHFDIFRYQSSADLLLAYIEYKKNTARYFSISGWARKLELPTSGILVNILKRRRLPPEELGRRLAQNMDLTPIESEYFSTLIAWERAKQANALSTVSLRRRLDSLIRRADTEILDESSFRRIPSLAHIAIKELLGLANVPATPEGIRQRLDTPVDASGVEAILRALHENGFLEILPDGSYRPLAPNIESGGEQPSSAIRAFHRESLAHASRALETVPLEERHFSSYVLPIARDRLPAAKQAIETFLDEFSGEFEAAPGTGNEVYQLNVQYVPLTKPDPRSLS